MEGTNIGSIYGDRKKSELSVTFEGRVTRLAAK